MNGRRVILLKLFLRSAIYIVAFAFSAVGIVRSVAISRQVSATSRLLQIAENKIAKLRSKNEELDNNTVLSASLRKREDRNQEFIAEFYHRCQDASDLPHLKTDFIVVSDSGVDLSPYGFVFSVPSGQHKLSISCTDNSKPVLIEIPLVPSSGYFLRFRSGSESESGNDQLVAELSSNASSFDTVQRALPISVSQLASPPLVRYEHLFYPNETYALEPADSDRGVSIFSGASFLVDGGNDRFNVKVVSDSQLCVTGSAPMLYGHERIRLEPYSGNGRFYIPKDKPSK